MEAMKMEMEVKAHKPGTISEILVSAGEQVQQAQALINMSV
jgi:pyruvate carboxylase subunit B